MSHLLFPCGTYTIGNFHDICTYLCENDSREWKEVEDLTHGYSPPNSGIPHIMELLDGLSSTLNFLSLPPLSVRFENHFQSPTGPKEPIPSPTKILISEERVSGRGVLCEALTTNAFTNEVQTCDLSGRE